MPCDMRHHPITARRTKATLTQQLTLAAPALSPVLKAAFIDFFGGGLKIDLGTNNDILFSYEWCSALGVPVSVCVSDRDLTM